MRTIFHWLLHNSSERPSSSVKGGYICCIFLLLIRNSPPLLMKMVSTAVGHWLTYCVEKHPQDLAAAPLIPALMVLRGSLSRLDQITNCVISGSSGNRWADRVTVGSAPRGPFCMSMMLHAVRCARDTCLRLSPALGLHQPPAFYTCVRL